MTVRATKPCEGGCNGTGRIKREVRKMENGEPDPLDFRREELCLKCGGEGVVTDWGGKPVSVREARSGFLADQVGVEAFWKPPGTGSFC